MEDLKDGQTTEAQSLKAELNKAKIHLEGTLKGLKEIQK